MYVGFSTATTAMSGQKQTLMLHLYTTTNNILQSTLGQALCMIFWLGLTCYPDSSMHRFTRWSGRKATRNAGGNPVGTQEKHVVPAQWDCSSLCTSGLRTSHRNLQQSLDWMVQACGLASQVTRIHNNGLLPMGPYWALISCHHFMLKRILSPILLRQQPDIFESHVNLCSVIVGCISRSEVVHLNICSKLVQNTTFLQNTSVVLLDFQP